MSVHTSFAGETLRPILTPQIIKNYEGKCVAIKNGKVIFSNRNADKVLEKIMKTGKPNDYYFSSIPLSSAVLVKS